MAYDSKLVGDIHRIFVQAVFSLLRRIEKLMLCWGLTPRCNLSEEDVLCVEKLNLSPKIISRK